MDSRPQPIRLATFLSPAARIVYEAVADYLGTALGIPVVLVDGNSFRQFADGTVDAGFICGLPYVQLTRDHPPPVELLAAPVLHGERYGAAPIYFSDVIVRADSPFRTFADLRGRSWSYNDVDSHSGYNITRYHLIELGETGGYFGRVVEAGAHHLSIGLVADGKVDASAIDSQVLALLLEKDPELAARLRVIETLGPSPIQPVVAATRLPADLKTELRVALLAMDSDPRAKELLARGLVERFVAVEDSHYDPIRRMLGAAEELGFMTLKSSSAPPPAPRTASPTPPPDARAPGRRRRLRAHT